MIEKKLEESGDKEKLEEYLRQKLIESGWKDELKKKCITIIRNKGLDKINFEELVTELLPHGRSLVRQEIKEDLLNQIKGKLEKDEDYKRMNNL